MPWPRAVSSVWGMNEPLTLKTLPDLLRAIPEMLGFVPQECLVVMPLNGRFGGTLLRADLPKSPDQAADVSLSTSVVDQLLRLGDVDGVYLIVFTDEPANTVLPPYVFTLARLADFVRMNGIAVRAGVCVASDRWVEYWGDGSGSRDEVHSLVHDALPRGLPELATIPPAGAAARERVAALIASQRDLAEITDDEVLCAWSLLLEGANWLDPVYEPILIALVARGLARPRTLEMLVADGVFGTETSERVEAAWIEFSEQMTDTELIGLTEVFAEFVPADVQRVQQAILALRSIAAHLEGAARAQALSALAWVYLLCAAGSYAQAFAREALRGGDHPLAVNVLELIDEGYVPGWVDGASVTGAAHGAAELVDGGAA